MPEIAFGELFEPAFQPFVIAAIIVALIALLEIVSAVFGLAISSVLDDFLPGLDIDGDADAGMLSWLGFGHAPFLVVLIVILSVFSVAGILIQALALGWLGWALWPALAVVIALGISLPLAGWLSRRLAWLIPSVESSGIHRDELVGRSGRITLGTATGERTAEAEVVDPNGLRHWIRVRAERGETIEPGAEVRIIERESRSLFVARRQG
ncbi:DUF1449 family protein [Wenzhouxiangella sp. AB-CW3]|uniref:OB-fold-containig protein n=1 Tax=Wenzhouxiangella sp. AB-CW3 TaxID=2771012 RepID=UPI00168B8988|nr:OB-fold-containig protein [Wenzhouxiangella sp. AB-CW3]QOC21715.1 DUF1449 family protein [Wenzhouxiangella sp. AB-CW3]